MTKPLPRKVIRGFYAQYQFLSNFADALVWYRGESYPTVEHAYQAAKFESATQRQRIASKGTPGAARVYARGHQGDVREDWKDVRVDVMRNLLVQKFEDRLLRTRLLETEDAELVETNIWKDVFWGVCDGVGKNQLGLLLMDVRALYGGVPRRTRPFWDRDGLNSGLLQAFAETVMRGGLTYDEALDQLVGELLKQIARLEDRVVQALMTPMPVIHFPKSLLPDAMVRAGGLVKVTDATLTLSVPGSPSRLFTLTRVTADTYRAVMTEDGAVLAQGTLDAQTLVDHLLQAEWKKES